MKRDPRFFAESATEAPLQPEQTTMVRLTPRRRTVVVETLRELANLVVGALVLGRFVTDRPWSFGLMAGGLALWFVLLGVALLLAEEKNDG